MAQLKNGTSIGGNIALHTGNISSLFQAIQDYSGDVTFKQKVSVNGALHAKGEITSENKILASSKGRTIGGSTITNGAIVIDGVLGMDGNEIQSSQDLHIGSTSTKVTLRLGTTEKLSVTNGSVAFSVPITEQGTSLSSKYLGKNAKAVDSDKLDGVQLSTFYTKDGGVSAAPSMFHIYNSDDSVHTTITQRDGSFISFERHPSSKNSSGNSFFSINSGGIYYNPTANVSSGQGHKVYHQGFKPTAGDVGALGVNAKAKDSDKLDGLNSTDFLKQHTDWKEYTKVYTVSNTVTLPMTDYNGANIGTNPDRTFLIHSYPNSTGTVTGRTVIVKVDGNKVINIKDIYNGGGSNNAVYYVENGILRVKSNHANNYNYSTNIKELRNNSSVFDYLETYRKDQSDSRFLGKTAKAVDSSKLNGFTQSETTSINTIVKRNGSSDIVTRLFRSTYQNQSTISGALAYRVNNGSDNYIRYCSNKPAIREYLNVFSKTESNTNFLAKTAKAADSDKLDGINSTGFARLGFTSQPSNYLYIHRSSSASTLYSVNGGTGDLARFIQGAAGSTENSTKSVVITNSGGINATSTILAPNLSSHNPNNTNATVSLNYGNDKARIRVGGSGVGTVGFAIQGTGDNNMADFTGSEILVGTGKHKVWHRGHTNLIFGQNSTGSTKLTDLNSIWKSGFYDGESLINSPIAGTGWGWILNIAHTNNSSSVKYGGQLIIENDSNNPDFWFRARASNGNGTWKQVLSKSTGGLLDGQLKAQGTGNDYNSGAVEVRGNGTTNTVFPTIGFHQSGKFASSIQLRNGADFRLYAQGSNSYADLRLRNAYHSGASVYEGRNNSPMGVYDSAKTTQMWSMGSSYRNSSSGADFGNLYGFGYKHTNNTTGGSMAGGHQAVWCSNGDPKSAIGENLWTKGSLIHSGGKTAIKFSDQNKYVFATGGNYDWGLFWDTNVNEYSFRGNGNIKWRVDCDTGTTHQNGYAYFNTSIETYIGSAAGASWFSNKVGAVNINTSSSGSTAHALLRQRVSGTQKSVLEALNSGTQWRLRVSSGNIDFNSGGHLTASGNVTAYSDLRTKRDIKVIGGALDKIGKLKGVTFNRTDLDLERQTGLIAQDLQKVLPEAVTESSTDDLKTFPDGKKLSVSYGNVVGLLVEGIKEERQKREELEKEVQYLKAKLADNEAFRGFVLSKLDKLERGE